MYRISQLATKVGLSRTALLYYEKLQLITGERLDNGYRMYDDTHVQRIYLIHQLQAGGLSLEECKACLEAKIDRELLKKRLQKLDAEITKKQKSRQFLAAILGEGNLRSWHEDSDKLAPDAHLNWLRTQGFSEKEALRLKWLSKDMNKHDRYMADFMKVFEALDRWGPGSESDTLQAFSSLPIPPKSILEIGCGNGLATIILAKNSNANITAVDNEQSALMRLSHRIEANELTSRVTAVCVSMTELPFDKASFDLIWSEASAYVMGVTNALSQWKPLLDKNGVLLISDLVWLTDSPSQDALEYWSKEYPDIQSVSKRTSQMESVGYEVLTSFPLSADAWQNYYGPLSKRVDSLKTEMENSDAIKDIENEIANSSRDIDDIGYQMFLLRSTH